MKIKEEKKQLRNKTTNQLYEDLNKYKDKVVKLNKDMAFGKLKSPQKLKNEKKKIAFILTIIREKLEKDLEKNEKK